MLKILHGLLIIDKLSKMYVVCMVFRNPLSLASYDFHDKTKLWLLRLWHINEKGLIELDNRGLLGSKKLKN